MQHVLQTGLLAGLSATSGFHSNKPKPKPKDYDHSRDLLPFLFVPRGVPHDKVVYRGKNGNVEASRIVIGSCPWDDSKLGPMKQAWQICLKNGVNFIDTAQLYGLG